MSTAKLAKIFLTVVWCVAVLSLLTNSARLNAISGLLLGLSFFGAGGFFTFANRETITQFWGANSRLGRLFADSDRSNSALQFIRFIGMSFIAGMVVIAFITVHARFAK